MNCLLHRTSKRNWPHFRFWRMTSLWMDTRNMEFGRNTATLYRIIYVQKMYLKWPYICQISESFWSKIGSLKPWVLTVSWSCLIHREDVCYDGQLNNSVNYLLPSDRFRPIAQFKGPQVGKVLCEQSSLDKVHAEPPTPSLSDCVTQWSVSQMCAFGAQFKTMRTWICLQTLTLRGVKRNNGIRITEIFAVE